MSKVWFTNALRGATLVAVALAFAGDTAGAEPRPGVKRRAFNLFAGVLGRMNVNRFDCGLDAFGQVCVDPFGSSTVGGGFWPKGTPDQYVFNSGLQLAGIIDPGAGFAWANDTVGAFFFDPKGTTIHGDRLSLVWNSLDAGDDANWPRDAYVPDDPTLFAPILIGRKAASQQDSWIQYWDGNPAFNAGRKHPLGVLVTQRGMAWNFPSGNEDIIYYLYEFTNVTARDPAVYGGLPNADSLASLGARFQTLNEATFGVSIPDNGYTITNMYAAFSMDPDVSDAARENYSTAFLPFNMGTAFKNNWFAPEMIYPPATFSAPFVAAPGVVGVKYLRSPVVAGVEVGLTMFSNTINDGLFDDAQNAVQLWRYLSARLSAGAGDAPCNAPLLPSVGKVCFVSQDANDIRFFQSSGPLSLAPGETKVIVVAYIAAAPVNTPAIAARGPSLDLKPGFPAQPAALATGSDTLRSVDRVFGAVSVADANMNGVIEQTEVVTVDRSLLDKGLVAQAVFDGKFLLPFPPDAPEFFLVPGDNQVTVVWRQSATEAVGDPYFQIARLPVVPDPDTPGEFIPNALYDPNYRQFDVEGYRIYRGRTTDTEAMELLAQFDYSGTLMYDFTGAFNYGNCAPELGVTTDCPTDLATGVPHPLLGNIIQVPPGGRVELATPPGEILVLEADTAVTGGASGNPVLSDAGVPFAFVDKSVRNSFRYYYTVTAFDINSVKSVSAGNTALESAKVTKDVTPRSGSGQQTSGSLASQALVGYDGQPIPGGTQPMINAATGIFSGPSLPTNGVQLGLAAFLPEVLGTGSVTLTIDSVVPGASLAGVAARYYVTGQGAGAPNRTSFTVLYDQFDEDHEGGGVFQATPIDGSKAARYGGSSAFELYGSVGVTVPGTWKLASWGRGNINGAPALSDYNGPRWWTGAANENTPDPNGLQCPTSPGGCVQGDLSRNAGALAGVDVLFHPHSYATVPNVPMRDLEGVLSNVTRAADFSVTWGAGGTIDSVFDLVHRVRVPFHEGIRASWGFLNAASFSGTLQASTADGNNALLTWSDIFCVAPAPALLNQCGGAAQTPAVLMSQAELSPIAGTSSSYAGTSALTATGNGFVFYLNGHFFLMQMTSLPAAGTVWYARFYSGTVIGAPGSYTFVQETRPPAVPGLRVQIAYQGSAFDPTTTTATALDRVHTVPDPYYVTNAFEQSPNTKVLRFVNLPSRCIIRIYSLSGILVNALTLNDPTGGGEVSWNLRNRNNQFVASGVYFYHVETPDGRSKVGRFTVVNFAQ